MTVQNVDLVAYWCNIGARCLPCLLLVWLLTLSACVQQPQPKYSGRSVMEQHRQLLRGASLFPADEPLPELAPVELLAVNDDMRAFLREHIPNRAISGETKARLILKGLLDDGLRLHYNSLKTYTAEETFYAREGNCLSFTNLYMALAREAGLVAMFQEVKVPPAWSAEGDTHYFNLHINVLVDLPRKQQVVDFDTQVESGRWRHRVVGDKTAAAQYYNNMAIHYLTEGDLQQAFLHSRQAIDLRPNTAYFWSNLGTIFRRAGDFAAAEESYLVAIDMNGEPAAISNIARLYRQRGVLERAEYYEVLAENYRMQNPYYLFELAQIAYEEGDYPRVTELLESAIRKRRNEHQFHHLLGLTWARLGKAGKAEKSFQRAARLVQDPELESLYQHKLQLLAQVD